MEKKKLHTKLETVQKIKLSKYTVQQNQQGMTKAMLRRKSGALIFRNQRKMTKKEGNN